MAFLNHYKNFFFVQLSISLFLRVFFFFLNDLDQYLWLLQGAFFDILFCLCLYGILAPLSILFFKLSSRVSFVFQTLVLITIFFIQYATEIYYHSQNSLLGKSVLFYSIDDLFIITNTSESNTWVAAGTILVSIIITIGIFRFFGEIKLRKVKLALFVFIGITLSQFAFRNTLFGDNEGIESGAVNKSAYFLRSILSELTSTPHRSISDKLLFRESFKGRQYYDDDYPLSFLSESDESNLSPFFEKSNTPPDVVLIIVESLSRIISGRNSTHPSLTPYLDSLAEKSLVWDNCLSSSERTFGVLPGILGSLPYGQHGLLLMGGNMPKHISLVNILEKNGYESNFYYGGNIGFDNTDLFLNRERFDRVESSNYIKKNNLVYWGLTDSIVFDKSLKYYNSNAPQLHTYLTLSTHGPFDYEGKEKLSEYINQDYIPSTGNKQLIEWSNETPDLLASFYYADQQVKHLINKIENTKNYKNTIFIITGDHGLPFDKKRHSLKNYHVPLIIYSPLLKESKRFGSLVSHLDIVPAFQKLLAGNFNFEIPTVNHYIGQDLDTNANFVCNRHIPLMSANKEVEIFVKDSLVYYKNELHKLSNNLNVFSEIDAPQELSSIKKELESYKALDQYVCDQDRLISTNDAKNWITHYQLITSDTVSVRPTADEYVNIFHKVNFLKEGYIKMEVDLTFPDSSFNLQTYPKLVLSVMNGDEVISYTVKNIFEPTDENTQEMSLNKTVAIEAFVPAPLDSLQAFSMNSYLWNSKKVIIPLEKMKFRYSEEN